MKRLAAVFLLCLFLLSCADGTDISVARQSGMFDFGSETVTERGTATETVTETERVTPGTLPDLPDGYRDAAQTLLEDPDFLALADGFGGRDDPAAVLAALLAVLGENAETEGLPSRSLPEDKDTVVYYTPGGSVWHTRRDCPALNGSKEILSGTVTDAEKAGKSRECKRCGDS